jgi:hypothetical protein
MESHTIFIPTYAFNDYLFKFNVLENELEEERKFENTKI